MNFIVQIIIKQFAGGIKMQQVIIVLSAAISFIFLFIYDFLSACRILKQEKFVEKIWKKILPNSEYNEVKVFVFVRQMILLISFMFFLVSKEFLLSLVVFKILLYSSPILYFSSICTIRSNDY